MRRPVMGRGTHEETPDDLRPGRPSRFMAHFSTLIEGAVPLVLFFSGGGWPTYIAAFVMLCFHFGIFYFFKQQFGRTEFIACFQ